jgi:hypothetical protein
LFEIVNELNCDLTLVRTTSDEYFARDEPLAPTGDKPFDLAFIDGLHLFEFALRDFMNTERHSSSRGVIIFDDVLPRNVDEAARDRHTRAWTGDVYTVLEVLAKYRPDLTVMIVGTQPNRADVGVWSRPGQHHFGRQLRRHHGRVPSPRSATGTGDLAGPPHCRGPAACPRQRHMADPVRSRARRDPAEVRAPLAKCLEEGFGTDFAAANLMAAS